ncbi:Hypothetical protein NTJ_14069 [Nesidiocoris tenuis]|uniref:PiggyBac transposable element-derived protein domain-containing protein n=1 Tax=Nesidiocoris tenuis TaxID=355587 RepID=A0ABN7BC46_9HEMI|nr:Hypothetical protein NTJ_14069 [Nesidiocoris tenuis]
MAVKNEEEELEKLLSVEKPPKKNGEKSRRNAPEFTGTKKKLSEIFAFMYSQEDKPSGRIRRIRWKYRVVLGALGWYIAERDAVAHREAITPAGNRGTTRKLRFSILVTKCLIPRLEGNQKDLSEKGCPW